MLRGTASRCQLVRDRLKQSHTRLCASPCGSRYGGKCSLPQTPRHPQAPIVSSSRAVCLLAGADAQKVNKHTARGVGQFVVPGCPFITRHVGLLFHVLTTGTRSSAL